MFSGSFYHHENLLLEVFDVITIQSSIVKDLDLLNAHYLQVWNSNYVRVFYTHTCSVSSVMRLLFGYHSWILIH